MSELPPGWAKATLAEICLFNPKHDAELDRQTPVSFVPMPAVSEETGTITEHVARPLHEVWSGYTHFRDGDVIFAKITPCMENGKIAVASTLTNGIACGSTEFHVLRPADGISAAYIWRFLRQESYRRDAEASMTGAVGQRRVPKSYLESSALPLPPSAEQSRIVAKLDRLFERTTSAGEELAHIPTLVEHYKQAILRKAFNGELTADFREKHPTESAATLIEERQCRIAAIATEPGRGRDEKTALLAVDADLRSQLESISAENPLPTSWVWAGLGQVFGVYVGATPSRKDASYWGGDINWVSSGEVAFCTIKGTEEKITQKGLDNASTRIHPPGTVLLGMIGEGKTRGQAAILAIAACNNQNCAAIRVSEAGYPPEYLYWYLYLAYEQTRTSGAGNNQPALNKDRVQRLSIPVAPVNEAKEVVRAITIAFAWLEKIEREHGSAASLLSKLDQAISMKAFKGELVPQDPADEPAERLLERIRSERGAQAPARRGRRARAGA